METSTLVEFSNRNQLRIVAGTYVQAKDWADRMGLSRCQWVYVSSLDPLRGLRGIYFTKTGTWWEHPAIDKIKFQLDVIGAVEITFR